MEENKYSYLNQLLIVIKKINSKYPKRDTKKEFNLFKVIRKGHEEVTLHSKFLFELLDPFGSHGMKNHFLNLFIDKVNSLNPDFHFNPQGARAHYEKQNIDLLIQNHSQAIIIENKIFAGDQPNQIYRYCDNIYGNRTKDILIIYLTLNGKKPSDQSISCPDDPTGLTSNKEKIDAIIKSNLKNYSYQHLITPWLQDCLKTEKEKVILSNCITQYIKLIEELTMSKEIEERIELVNFLGQKDLMQQAHYIVDNWKHVKWHVEMDFWDSLRDNKPDNLKNFSLNTDFTYSVDNIDKSAHSSRRSDADYGLALNLFSHENGNVIFMVYRGYDSISYGIRIIQQVDHNTNNQRVLKPVNFVNYLKQACPEYIMGEAVSDWIQWRYIKPDINFEEFKTGATLSLANPEKRKNLIADLWQEISDYIEIVMKWDGIPTLMETSK